MKRLLFLLFFLFTISSTFSQSITIKNLTQILNNDSTFCHKFLIQKGFNYEKSTAKFDKYEGGIVNSILWTKDKHNSIINSFSKSVQHTKDGSVDYKMIFYTFKEDIEFVFLKNDLKINGFKAPPKNEYVRTEGKYGFIKGKYFVELTNHSISFTDSW